MTADAATEALAVPIIGFSIIADHPGMAYLADPEAGRPATKAEMAKIEAAAYEDYATARFLRVPRGPWPTAAPAVTAQAPEPAADPLAGGGGAGGALARLSVAYRGASGDAPAEDPAPVLDPIAELAAERHGADGRDPARFLALHDAQDEREATATLTAVDAASAATVPAVPADGAA